MPFLTFTAEHLAILLLVLACAAGMGTLAARSQPLPLRMALGLAVWAEALFLLAAIDQLRPIPIATLAILSLASIRPPATSHWQLLLAAVPLFLLALHPPLAFDETLYHLPTIRSLATFGELRFVADLRFPLFPQLHELLCVPVYLLAGDTATHLVSLAEVLVTAAILVEWGGRLPAAFFLGSPIVLHLATIGYVDAALTLFVTAAFYCLQREKPHLGGLLLGVACGVKYVGGYFAVAGFVSLLLRNRRDAAKFAAWCAAAALPTTLSLVITTGNPIFPFFDATYTAPHLFSFTPPWRVLWDVTFAHARVNFEPPMTPLLIPAIAIVVARARGVAILAVVYVALFAFLPQDSRYLVPLLPLIAIAASAAIPNKRWLVWLAIAPGILYAGYRLYVTGIPPATSAEREAELTLRVPEYRAVTQAGNGAIYVCGGEQLKYYAKGTLLGDFFGPYAYKRVLDHLRDTSSIAARLRPIHAGYYLVAKRACRPPRSTGGMDLVYEDAAAQLWRVQPSQPSRR
ncbi:MAG TPA: hypothetical protein VGJ81_09655 [Thermoanaerobaculia bacterium]|jgi:hypothetical protein